MASLKSDLALATNLLGRDPRMCNLLGIATKADKANQIIPMRQTPGEASDKPIVAVYVRALENLGSNSTSNQLLVDVYVPLTTQKNTGVSLDIVRRVKEVLDRKPIGRGLRWSTTDPDRLSTTGWHKATVTFTFNSAQF